MSSYPTLYQVNTRARLYELSTTLGRPAHLNDIPDADLDQWAQVGFDWIWMLGVWQTGEAGRNVSRSVPEWRAGYARDLPDFTDDDIVGSPFAISSYTVHREFGGAEALANLRSRMRERGLRLMLDFVPNHTALDHPWVSEHPDYYLSGSEVDHRFAYGRDPYFPGWPDTVQLNYGNPELQRAMRQQLSIVASQCDGVRCDMAMLILPDVFLRTWGIDAEPFWPEAIRQVRQSYPGFVFMAEVYWDLEWELQQQGFDYTYDKRLYDRLHDRNTGGVRDHLRADLAFQTRSARFLENHDEPRAAEIFGLEQHQAAALITFLIPGLRFFHEGQFEGRTRRCSMHLRRRAQETAVQQIADFYAGLLRCIRKGREGEWRLIDPEQAWPGNPSHQGFIAFSWEADGRRLVVAVNYANHQAQCYVRPTFQHMDGAVALYLDLPSWGYQVFDLSPVAPA